MESSTEQDERVTRMVSAAMRKAPAERELYLRLACQEDPQLYQETIDQLGWEERMGSFLLHPMVAFNDFVRPFQPGQIISERFEIVREIGDGGMGVVYEAFDRKRKQRIAIKAAKPGFQRLLSPELEGALSVRHPNVCLVNEIHTAQTPGGEVDFLSMEFLEGETLWSRLQARGKLNQQEALEVALQLCAGLAEAHRSGIIHRDLKSANVILCRTANEGLRAVITDFGLSGTLQSGELGGTPGYMAPELWQGGKASMASDLYSLGTILYEMVTGCRPFGQKSPSSGQIRRPPAPSTLTKGVDPGLDRVIMQCLAIAPAERPSDAREVLARLERKPVRKAPVLVSALVVLALAFAALTTSVRELVVDFFWPGPNVRLAVLPLEGSMDSAAVGGGVLQDVSERVGHLRSGHRTVVVIPPSQSQSNKVQTPEQAKNVLHATHALETSLRREGDDYVVEGSVIDLATQAHLRSFSTRYSKATVGALPSALAGEVSLALRLRTAAVPETLSAEATGPYDKGLYLLRTDEQTFENAIALFREAARLDPRSPLPPAALVEAEIVKYGITRDRHWLDEAQRALREAESLNPDSARVRQAGGLLNKRAGQYQKALEDYRRVQELEPDNVEVLLEIASIYFDVNMPDKAIETYREAIAVDPGYYRSYEQLGNFYYYRSAYPNAVEEFQQAINRAPGRFVAYSSLGAALTDLGRYEEAEQALLQSLKLRETAPALNNLGAIRAYQQRDAEAVEYYERAVAMDPNDYVNVENLADSYRRLGRLKSAKTAYGNAMNLALRDLAENPSSGYPRGFVAYCAVRLGDTRRSEAEISQAVTSSPDDKGVIRNAVLTYDVLGQRDKAVAVLGRATPELLHELQRHPDLADFCQDPRFKELVAKIEEGGK
jgi:eukaryotic-like serine/threonine-protein kinase